MRWWCLNKDCFTHHKLCMTPSQFLCHVWYIFHVILFIGFVRNGRIFKQSAVCYLALLHHKVIPTKCAHILCFILLWLFNQFVVGSRDYLKHKRPGCFTVIGFIILYIAPMPVAQSWRIWDKVSRESIMSKCPYPGPVVFHWQSGGNPVCLELRPQWTLECHWRKNCCQCASSGLPVVFQWLSSGLPVCSNYANLHWIATGTPLGASFSQCGSSGIPVYLWLQWSSSVFQLCKLTLDRRWDATGC